MEQQSRTQSGNVAFIILLAIALFAALSFILTQNRDSNTSLITEQQAKIAAQEIISYGTSLTGAFQKVKLRGCLETQLNVYHVTDFNWGTYTNGAAPTDKSCNIYDSNGGGVNSLKADKSWFVDGYPTSYWGYSKDSDYTNIGTTAADLVFYLGGLKEPICIQINNLLGIGQKDAAPPSTSFYDTFGFVGSFPASAAFTMNQTDVNGKLAFCVKDTDNYYKFVQVVLAR